MRSEHQSSDREFSFRVFVDANGVAAEALFERIAVSDCGDGTFGTSAGQPHLRFTRDAKSLQEAIETAIGDLASIGLHAVEIEVDRNELAGPIAMACLQRSPRLDAQAAPQVIPLAITG